MTAIRLPEKEKCTRQGAGSNSNSKRTGRQTPSGCKEEDYENQTKEAVGTAFVGGDDGYPMGNTGLCGERTAGNRVV